MDTPLKTPDWENEPGDSDAPRRDASFSEIYELIFHNNSLVLAELEVLRHLLQNKIKNGTATAVARDNSHAHMVYKKQAVLGRT